MWVCLFGLGIIGNEVEEGFKVLLEGGNGDLVCFGHLFGDRWIQFFLLGLVDQLLPRECLDVLPKDGSMIWIDGDRMLLTL